MCKHRRRRHLKKIVNVKHTTVSKRHTYTYKHTIILTKHDAFTQMTIEGGTIIWNGREDFNGKSSVWLLFYYLYIYYTIILSKR